MKVPRAAGRSVARARWRLALGTGCWVAGVCAGAQAAPSAEALFEAVAVPPAVDWAATGPPRSRQRLVTVRLNALEAAAEATEKAAAKSKPAVLSLNLFPGERVRAVVERTFPVDGGRALRGRLLDVPGGRMTLAVRGETLTGTVLTPTQAFVIQPAGAGRHVVGEVHRAYFPYPGVPSGDHPPPPSAQLPEWPAAATQAQAATPVSRPKAVGGKPPGPLSAGHRDSPVPDFGARWRALGPGPIVGGQVENIHNFGQARTAPPPNEVVGAVHTVLAHPTNADLVYIGATNGGVWRTDNATAQQPTWRPLTDDASSLSIGAMAFDAAAPTTLLVGIGRYSSFGRLGGDSAGLLLSRDGGETWRELNDPLFLNQNISGVAVRGERLVVSAGPFAGGVFRSIDGGTSWASVEGVPTSAPGLDLVEDPTDADRLYATIQEDGVYRSDDGGATWRNVSSHDAALNGAFTRSITRSGRVGSNNNAEIAVGVDGRVFVAVLVAGQAQYIGYSDDRGGAWTAMDLPLTQEDDGETYGLNPRFKPGGQGAVHFSILVDPNNTDLVYVGGDRQHLSFSMSDDGQISFHNAIGATDWTGRLFRGDARVAPTGGAPSPQWQHMTHRDDVADIPGGGTATASSPHADSREMVFDARGDIIEVDDGGVYRRTSPQDNRGDWFSMNGNLQVTEMHDVAYDSLGKVVLSGNQDTGSSQQRAPGVTAWDSLTHADGGDVAVDTSEAPERSHRYSSRQFLGGFRRISVNADNEWLDVRFPELSVNGVNLYEIDPTVRLVQRFSLNTVTPSRAVIGTSSLYETADRFETLTEIRSLDRDAVEQIFATAFGCPSAPDLIYYGYGALRSVRGFIAVRSGLGADGVASADDVFEDTRYGGAWPRAIVIDQDDCATVYAVDHTDVHVSNDAGATWRAVTGNLTAAPVNAIDLRDVVVVPAGGLFGANRAIVVAGRAGVHVMFPDNEGHWYAINEGLPHAPVWELDYSAADAVLVAGTLGRGAWSLTPGPTAVRRVADRTLEVASGDVAVDLTELFADPAAGGLAYGAESSDPAVASVAVVAGEVVVTPRNAGVATIRITATDATGASGLTAFTVTVGAVLSIAPSATAHEGDDLILPVRFSQPLPDSPDSFVLRYVLERDGNPYTPDASAEDHQATGYLVVPGGARKSYLHVRIVDDSAVEPTREVFKIKFLAPDPNPFYGLGPQAATTVTINEGVCDRAPAIRDAIRGDRDCAAVASLSGVTSLDISERGLSSLEPGDFDGLSGLRTLNLAGNGLRALSSGVFAGLDNLLTLDLSDNQLADLPEDLFFETPALIDLWLSGNRLTTLPPTLFLANNTLSQIFLDGNLLTELPSVLLRGQFLLTRLHLQDNRLTSLPAGLFQGLSEVGRLRLDGNPGAPFDLRLRLDRVDADPAAPAPAQVALRLREGAPFALTAPLEVDGGAVNVTAARLPTGHVIGAPVAVWQNGDAPATVTISAPPVPAGDCGLPACYEGIVVSVGGPLVLFDKADAR